MQTYNMGAAPVTNFKKSKVLNYNGDIKQAVLAVQPKCPTYFYEPEKLKDKVDLFLNHFPGDVAYAVKCNPSRQILQTMTKAGITCFDVASLDEIQRVRKINPSADLYYMNPIKTPEAIHAAYFQYDVRTYVLDHKDELYKIMRETGLAQDLNLYIRLALPKNNAARTDFSSKFGADFDSAIELLKLARPVSKRLGISFHVGTQSMDPEVYARAIAHVRKIVDAAEIEIDSLDVGGGFPVDYPNAQPAPLTSYFDVIRHAITENGFEDIHILSEPGRALVSDCMTLVTRIDMRRNDILYINDGLYGGLTDIAPWQGIVYHHELVQRDAYMDQCEMGEFRLTGPTCDSVDMMNGPFVMSNNAKIGDWVMFKQTGAYSQSVRTGFNGFTDVDVIQIKNTAKN